LKGVCSKDTARHITGCVRNTTRFIANGGKEQSQGQQPLTRQTPEREPLSRQSQEQQEQQEQQTLRKQQPHSDAPKSWPPTRGLWRV
jgi:hypothetical protein